MEWLAVLLLFGSTGIVWSGFSFIIIIIAYTSYAFKPNHYMPY